MSITPYEALKIAGYPPLQAKRIVRAAAQGEKPCQEAIAKALEAATTK